MNFTTKYAMALNHHKKALVAFIVLFVFSKIFPQYPFIGIIAMLCLIVYITAYSINVFVESIFEPKISYNDFFAVKYADLPVIPNQDDMYKFMADADKIKGKGAVHLSNEVLNHWNVDQFGNKR